MPISSSHAFSRDVLARWFFLFLAAGIFILFYQIIQPFLITVIAAAMASVLVTPLEKWLRRRVHHARVSTVIVLLGMLLLIVGPLVTAGILMARQGSELAQWIMLNPQALHLAAQDISERLSFLPESFRPPMELLDISFIVQAVIDWARTHGADLFSSGAALVFKAFIFFVSLYFFLVERERILAEAIALSPLKDSVDRSITGRMVETVRGVVFGSLIVACVQGIIAAIGLSIFGVPGALLWAALVIIAAQIPMLGTSVIMLPAVLYLFLVGETGAGIGLAIWAGVAVGLVDNLLQPIIVGGRTRMHALLILLSMLGGLNYFGPIGFILGPTILAALLVILEMYKGGFLER